MNFRRNISALLLLTFFLASCTSTESTPAVFPTYDPFLPIPGTQSLTNEVIASFTPSPTITPTREPTPTRAEANVPPFFGTTNQIQTTPTPDPARILPTPRQDVDEYVIQFGDTLGDIALRYGISVQALMQANNITDPNVLEVGTVLKVPAPNPIGVGTALKIIPDSELVYGPATIYFDIHNFIQSQNGYLATYTQDVNGIILTGSEIIELVATNYSVNPRLLLAILEYQSGWVTNPLPFNTSYPMGLLDENRYGLYRQLAWAANTLNRGYYLWKVNALSTYILSDGQVLPIDPTINAGTAAVQYFFSQLDDLANWQIDVNHSGVIVTYFVFFGNPFGYAIEPLIPANISQPTMQLPYSVGESWYFTGGPHGGWDAGSAWAALDFAPPNNTDGNCAVSPYWVTAMADGLIIRASNGAVTQDLDNDGYEQTGWVILYMHVAEQDRVQPNEYLFANEYIGHASCEGGVSNATHLHIARKYNGEWISADGFIPFNLSGWVSSGDNFEYDGFLTRGAQVVEAFDSANEFNLISR
ncbi:MAG: LysM peptidoglycan-binding domain-containing protein [Anaerolineales bacterium]|nr:LysM peptidoglycan-binding domain-containing protein [Anaerolineales bacterium]